MNRTILAVGAESKGVFCLLKGRNLFISKEFGNLGDYANLMQYEKAIKRLKARPGIIACDMHPDYNTTLFAQDLINDNIKLIKVQHHHAHIVSCMRDNNLKGRVLGIAFDGTGYGTDKNVWGGEFLIATLKDFKRAAHLKYMPMPGGDKAVIEPWRMGAAYLQHAFGDSFLDLNIPFVKKIVRKDWKALRDASKKGLNSPLTSSMGRLFDAVASMIIPIFKVSHEAEAAIKLQMLAEEAQHEKCAYKYKIKKEGGSLIIDPSIMIREIIRDIKKGIDRKYIAARFHNTIAQIILDVCKGLKRSTGIKKAAISGGVFQNKLLLNKVCSMLKAEGFDIYLHRESSATDAGISAGQAVVAGARCRVCV